MRRAIVVAMVLCGALTAGCGSAQWAQRWSTAAPAINVTGVWTGRAASRGALIPVTMTLTQSGTSVTGDMSVGGWSELTGGVTGSVEGELLTLSLERLTLGELTVKEDTMTGQVSAGLPVNLRRSK
jgi:hypothetical protein